MNFCHQTVKLRKIFLIILYNLIFSTNLNLSVKLKTKKQADSIADVPFSVLYKKVFPIYQGENIGINDISSNPVLINPNTQTLTFNISNLEPGAIYEVTQIAPTDFNNKKDDHNIQSLSYNGDQLLQYLKTVQGLPVNDHSKSGSGKQNKIYFAPLNVPVSLESAWSHPLRYDYYEGEQIYVRFNKEAGTAINLDWLKGNIQVKLIPNKTHGGQQGANQNPVEKDLSSAGTYNAKAIRKFGGDITLSDLQWDPLKTTATFRLQPKSLKSIVGAQIKITIKDINKYHLDPSQDTNNTQTTQSGTTAQQPQAQKQSITFRLQSSAAIVTPTNVDYMNPGLMGFSYAIYDPLDLIQKTGKDYNPFGEFPHLTPYNEQDWLKVVINKKPSNLNINDSLGEPDTEIFNNPKWDGSAPVRTWCSWTTCCN